mmetsp:Transcript_3937/g.8464  ORF Transcript_3937/g.8464 Transcript_3937/m.8464 type:complete len:211 (+) Transcript_3937:2476-3108(+)
MILVLARSPAKKTTKTLFSCISVVAGSCTLPTCACLRNMLPLVARNSRRSKLTSFSWWMRPATKPKRASLASTVVSRSESSSGAPKSCEGAWGTLVFTASRDATALALSKNWPALSRRIASSDSSACVLCRRSLLLLSSVTSLSSSSSLVSSSSIVTVFSHKGDLPPTLRCALCTCSVRNLSLRAISSHRLTWFAYVRWNALFSVFRSLN